ncbi:PQQ-binding-like beta-propeller repeat protein [Gemmata sp. JC673]|uniref:PQQ-binding-like beta-propeller repeat protein n=1 Tax=Gemmata algarum TaxID=2975278 RepID=A0ABU5F396_9BACT|nr:PQQ-binding-like beta-propeller repeat protein [Gemmata algarum]MDY3562057.1 PQQ-binding-like beta-propeller repeat protein [Gemmata algarum]
MSIVAQCPHCETRFTLQSEMSGKSMRCPNLECRQVFTVRPMVATAPPAPEPPPVPKPEPKPAPRAEPKPAPKKPPKPAEPEIVEAAIVTAAVVKPPKVKEVVWSEGTDVPPPKKDKKPLKPAPADDPDDGIVVRKKKKKSNRAPLLLAGMGIFIVAALGFAIVYILQTEGKKEEQLAKSAQEEYQKAEYAAAGKLYEKLVQDYPGSDRVNKYKFFADLSSTQVTVRAVTNRQDYEPALKRFAAFLESHKSSPLTKPTEYGRDVLEAGKKLCEDIAEYAGDRVTAYQADRAKSEELSQADAAVAKGRELVAALDPLRGPDDQPLDKLKGRLDQAEKSVQRERARTAAFARAKAQLEAPTDALILSAEAELRAAGFIDDPEVRALVATAKGNLRKLVRYTDDPAPPEPVPPTTAASLLFVTPVGKTKLHEAGVGAAPPTVFLCVARGILYALDEDTGTLLWATRVGADITDPPVVTRVTLAGGPTDIAVVASNVGGSAAVSGHALKTGAPLWYQPLPAPAGPAVVVGGRAFVPLRDPEGTVYEFDLATGQRIGHIRLGQTLAENGAVLRPGTNLLYVAAEARRLYVIDAGGKDDGGNRINPRCVQIVATGHLAGTLRVPPLFVGPEGTDPADRWLILSQSHGPTVTNLRAFPVGTVEPPPDGATVPEAPAAPAAEVPVPGWVWYPPVCDGERLAVASDTGQFRVFGVNQPGNLDKPLFPMAAPALPGTPDDRPVRGLVIPVGESEYWLLAGGHLQRARLVLVPNKGQDVVLAGTRAGVGEPVHGPQLSARKDAACLVVRSANSSGCRAVAFDLRTGEVRWQRQLGLVPAKLSSAERCAGPVPQGDSFVLVDEDGGIVVVPVAGEVAASQSLAAKPEWVIASAPPGASGPTVVAAAADGQTVFAVTPVTAKGGPKFVVRRVAGGKLLGEDEVGAPGELAGQPAVVGGALHIPAADGFVHRFIPGAGVTAPAALIAGPKWRGDRPAAAAVCGITPLSDTTFVTSDGGKKLTRWEWPPGANAARRELGEWVLREAVAGPGAVVPGEADGPPRLIVGDVSGSVWMFASDKSGAPLRRWRAGGARLPAGKLSSGLAVQTGEGNRAAVAYVVDGKAVGAIDPDRDEPLWTVPLSEDASGTPVGDPQPAGANRWVVTDLAGRVRVLDGATGAALDTKSVGLPGAVPAAASGVAGGTALVPLSDGSAALIELKK